MVRRRGTCRAARHASGDAVAASEAAWSEFVNSTGYVTVAERKPDWEELKKQLPPGAPKLDESALVAGAPVFAPPKQKFSLQSLAW